MPSEDVDLAVQIQNQQEEVRKIAFHFHTINLQYIFATLYFLHYLLHIFATLFATYICYIYSNIYLLQIGVEDVLMEVKDLSTGVYGEPYKVGCWKM